MEMLSLYGRWTKGEEDLFWKTNVGLGVEALSFCCPSKHDLLPVANP